MSNPKAKSKILIVNEVEFQVPESFEVVKMIYRTFEPMIIAIDNISKKKFSVSKKSFDLEDLFIMQEELACLLAHFYLNNSKTVKLHHLILPEDYQLSNHYYSIVEFMETNMHSVILSPQPLSPKHVCYFMYQLLLHLHYLHSNNLSLIYLSPKTILVNSDCELKLINPLLEFRINCDRIYQMNQFIERNDSLRWYLPPEWFLGNDLTLKSDMWNLGCIFYELVMRKPLFHNSNYANMIKMQIEGLGKLDQNDIDLVKNEEIRSFLMASRFEKNNLFDKVKGLCEDGMFILRNLLVFDPERRLSALECLMHPYFEEFFVEEDLFVEIKSFERVFDALFMEKDQIFWRLGELSREMEGLLVEKI